MKNIDTESSLGYWAKKARSGEKVVYYDGFLMLDRQLYFMSSGGSENQPEKLKVARLAWRLYTDGVLTLTQKKKDNFSYEYIAVKR